MFDDDDEVMENVQHLLWVEKLINILIDADDEDAASLVDDAAVYFDRLDDGAKVDLFVYGLGSLVRVSREAGYRS
jgi:hypothetical protein